MAARSLEDDQRLLEKLEGFSASFVARTKALDTPLPVRLAKKTTGL